MADFGACEAFQYREVSMWEEKRSSTKVQDLENSEQACRKTYALLTLVLLMSLITSMAAAVWVFTKSKQRQSHGSQDETPPAPQRILLPKLSPRPQPPHDDYEGDPYDLEMTPTASETTSSVNVCDTNDCRKVRKFIEAIVDTTRDPCEDFFAFVCGNYKQPAGMDVDNTGQDLSATSLIPVIVKSLETEHVPTSGQTGFQKSAALYKHCKEADSRVSAATARNFLAGHKMDVRKNMAFDLLHTLVEFIFEINIPLIFRFEPMEEGCPNFAFRLDSEAMSKSTDIRTVLSAIYSAHVGEKIVHSITHVENKIIEVSELSRRNVGRTSDGYDTFVVLDLWELGVKDNGDALAKEWTAALQHYASSRLLLKRKVNVSRTDVEFFHRLFGKEKNVPEDELRLFFAWRCIHYLYDVSFVKSQDCFSATFDVFPDAAISSALFHALNEERISATREMTEAIVGEIKESFRTTAWMDHETRTGALRKISMLRIRLGFAPKLNTTEKIDEFYRDLPDQNGPFLSDYLEVNAFQTRKYWEGVVHGYSDYFYEAATPQPLFQSNAYYSPQLNSVTILPSRLLRPYFSVGGPPEINYGGLGSTVAHEIMHGFDLNGRQYDGNGTLSSWFTRNSAEELDILERCYMEHIINNAPKARSYVQHLYEYQADVLGTGSLLRAYQKAARRSKVYLGNVRGLTRDQIFYVANCIQWCEGKSDIGDQLNATHPQGDDRCNVPLMNSVHFSETFSCRNGKPMNPPKKCPFW
ncbi:neprilysin-11-like [Ornithodoros turicata]|uniref:neprilysin-11-like n=1 Tax=Ornithodoros turicata TaxID=34597 RepID=UPI003138B8EF